MKLESLGASTSWRGVFRRVLTCRRPTSKSRPVAPCHVVWPALISQIWKARPLRRDAMRCDANTLTSVLILALRRPAPRMLDCRRAGYFSQGGNINGENGR